MRRSFFEFLLHSPIVVSEPGLLRRLFARVEHKVVVGIDFVQYAYRYYSNLVSTVLWDEAARTDLTRTLT